MSNTRTGLYIYELDSLVGMLKDDALLPISQDNLPRKIQARVLRSFINGDDSEPSQETYYSSSKVDELFENTSNTIGDINSDLSNISARIDALTNTVNSNYSTLDNRITNEINSLGNNFDSKLSALDTKLTNNMNTMQTNLGARIDALNTKLEGWILYGSAAPTNSTLPVGRLYIQYF